MKKALIGAGGAAKEIKDQMGDPSVVYFVDDSYWEENNEFIYPLSEFNPREYEVLIAIGDPRVRHHMTQKLPKETQYFNFIHPSAMIIGTDVKIGEGSVICAGCILTSNIIIGKHSYLNIHTTVSHDNIIGDFFTTAPGAKISGNCKIGNKVYLGANSSVRQKIKICDNVIIGLNAGVVKDIEVEGVYVGVPAIKIG